MNKDIRLSTSYFEHPKIIKLLAELGHEAVVCHVRLLTFTAKWRPKGILINMSKMDIAIAAGWSGLPDIFVDTLERLTLLDRQKNDLCKIHDWQQHNSYASFSKERSKQASENAKKGWEKRNGNKNKDLTSCDPHKDGIQPAMRNKCSSPSPSPKEKDKEKEEKEVKEKEAATFRLPEWIPREAWDGFIEMRRKIKKPMTDRAKELLLKKLAGLRAQGHAPGELLDQSVERAWQTVYAPTGKTAPGPEEKTEEKIDVAARRAIEAARAKAEKKF